MLPLKDWASSVPFDCWTWPAMVPTGFVLCLHLIGKVLDGASLGPQTAELPKLLRAACFLPDSSDFQHPLA